MNPVSRKEFLRLGLAAPLAMRSLALGGAAATNASQPPKRVIFICSCLGFYAPYFFPKSRDDLATSDYLKALAIPEKWTVFRRLFHPGMETSNHDSEKSFLTGAPRPESPGFVNGTSVDQILARTMGADTRFPFLNFSIYDRGWGISWNDRGAAIPPMHDEDRIFEMLFGEEDLRAKKKQLNNDLRVLEALYRDLDSIERQGGLSGQRDAYRAVIQELETSLEHQKFWLSAEKPKVENTLSDDPEFAFSAKVRNLFELSKLAFRTDSTRVITVTLDWIDGAIRVPGATGGWHTLSHHGGRPDTIAQLSKIEIDILRHFNQFLTDLDQIQEGDGTLLDHTTVVMGSNFGDASNHTCHDLPVVVAGGGFRHQGYRDLEKPTPLCNLYLELLHRYGIDVGGFGSSERDMGLLQG